MVLILRSPMLGRPPGCCSPTWMTAAPAGWTAWMRSAASPFRFQAGRGAGPPPPAAAYGASRPPPRGRSGRPIWPAWSTGVVSAEVAAYLDVLDRALEDRRITELEADALLAIAQEWGLSRYQVTDVHHQYLRALAQAAWADGEISSAEHRDLEAVCALLGVQPTVLASLLAGPMPPPTGNAASSQPQPTDSRLAGQSVCFTGALSGQLDGQPITRAQAEQLAAAAGLIVAPRVTKTLDLLVVADPNSLSSKAHKAREYGTRIMAEAVFWRAIGISVE